MYVYLKKTYQASSGVRENPMLKIFLSVWRMLKTTRDCRGALLTQTYPGVGCQFPDKITTTKLAKIQPQASLLCHTSGICHFTEPLQPFLQELVLFLPTWDWLREIGQQMQCFNSLSFLAHAPDLPYSPQIRETKVLQRMPKSDCSCCLHSAGL